MVNKFKVFAQDGKRWVKMSKTGVTKTVANKMKRQMQRHKPYKKIGIHNFKVGTKILKKWKKK